ncbi:MAG: ABC transporter ATP-binding protein [Planctomycetia bacterium]|nr:ABC transporter ATP-binding protein [Planctomycetia bacterium]
MKITVETPILESFRVKQVAGLFDVPLSKKSVETFEVETPDLNADDWSIGLIVGPSGSGKTTLARKLLGENLYQNPPWKDDAAVIDGFDPSLSIRETTALLTSVGFSSPPGWVKPYGVLSNGEKFRCDLARAISVAKVKKIENLIVAFDEFTSVVDRTVAKVASAAIAKGVKSGNIPCKFVAVTCHYDVAEWLEPDWVIDMASCTLSRRRLRRPEIRIEVVRCGRSIWSLFARHHYLSAGIASGCRCHLALWDSAPVAFCAEVPQIAKKNHWRVSRVVTLPDFQGLGIGMKFIETIGDMHKEKGERFNITGSHPAVISHCKRSPKWRAVSVSNAKSKPQKQRLVSGYLGAIGRVVASFEYFG